MKTLNQNKQIEHTTQSIGRQLCGRLCGIPDRPFDISKCSVGKTNVHRPSILRSIWTCILK